MLTRSGKIMLYLIGNESVSQRRVERYACMKFFRRVRLAVVPACLCASCVFPVAAQQQPPAQPPQTAAPQQQQQQPPQTQPPRPANPFETVPRQEQQQQQPPATPPATVQRPQMELPKQQETPAAPAGTQVIEAI